MISVPNTKYQPKDLTSLTQQLVSTIYPCSPDMRNLRNRGDGCLNARITRSSVDICFGRRFIVIYVWLAYHFMLNSVATYLRALGSLASSCWGGLWVESGLVGNPLLANASFACLGQNPPTAWDGLAHNGSLPFKPQMVIHYWHSTSEPALDMQGQFRASEKD